MKTFAGFLFSSLNIPIITPPLSPCYLMAQSKHPIYPYDEDLPGTSTKPLHRSVLEKMAVVPEAVDDVKDGPSNTKERDWE